MSRSTIFLESDHPGNFLNSILYGKLATKDALHTHIHTYIHTYIHIYIHTYTIHIHTYIQTHPRAHTHIHTHTHTRVHTNVRSRQVGAVTTQSPGSNLVGTPAMPTFSLILLIPSQKSRLSTLVGTCLIAHLPNSLLTTTLTFDSTQRYGRYEMATKKRKLVPKTSGDAKVA